MTYGTYTNNHNYMAVGARVDTRREFALPPKVLEGKMSKN
jgi:hypothetical protein